MEHRQINFQRQVQQLRWRQVMKLLRDGHTQAEMAKALPVAPCTISRDLQGLLTESPLLRPYRR